MSKRIKFPGMTEYVYIFLVVPVELFIELDEMK